MAVNFFFSQKKKYKNHKKLQCAAVQAVGQGGVVEMAKIGSAMCIGTVGSNPRGYTLLMRQVMHIPLHF